MSALKLFTSSNKSLLLRNLRNFNCALSPGCVAHEWSRQVQDPGRNNLLATLNVYRQSSTKKPHADVTKHVISEVKANRDDKYSVQEIAQSLGYQNNGEKLGLFKRFKLMYKQYWYVLIPVHVVTSIGWFGGFYYLSTSGVDVPALLQTLHISDTIVDRVKDSHMGHVAIAYVMYKIATPVRYAVTLGGTTFAINHLSRKGYIKPVPTKTQLMKIYEDKKADMAKKKQEKTKGKS